MHRSTSFVALVSCGVALLAASAQAQDPRALIGRWAKPGVTFEVRADASFSWWAPPQTLTGQVMVGPGQLRFQVQNTGQPMLVDYLWALSGDTLRLQDGSGQVFVFQRAGGGAAGSPAPGGAVGAAPVASTGGGAAPPQDSPITVEQRRAYLALLEGYRTMDPTEVERRYRGLHPTQRLLLEVSSALHADLVWRMCQGPNAGRVVLRDAGGVQSCAQIQASRHQAAGFAASMGMDPQQAVVGEANSQRSAAILSQRCSLGLEEKSVCGTAFQAMSNISRMQHETSLQIIDNMGPTNHYEWRYEPTNR